MNIFEYDKSKREDIGCGFTFVAVFAIGSITFVMYAILVHYYSSLTENAGGAFLTFIDVCTINENIESALPFVMWNTFLVLCVCVILYLFMRLLYKSYLFVTGQLWKSKNESWALSAVKRMNNQNKLKRVVKEISVSFCSVREAAVERITDQEFLKEVAIKASNNDVCKAAWNKISDFDQEFLKEVAIKASHSDVRIAAASKLFEIDHDDTSLKTIIFELGEKLKNSQDVDGRRKVAHYLHVIYMQYKNSSIGNNIRSYNGTLIYAGSKHTDGHTDEVTCTGNYDYGINFEHTNVHTDIPAEPAEYFSVE